MRLKDTVEGIRRRSAISQTQRLEHKKFEEVELRFRNAKNFEQWWECICKAGETLDFSRICLEMATRENGTRRFTWRREGNGHSDVPIEIQTVHLRIPMKDRRNGHGPRIEIDILPADSVESAGRLRHPLRPPHRRTRPGLIAP